MIPKQCAQDIEKYIGKYICRAPDREGGGGRGAEKTKPSERNDHEEYAYQNECFENDEKHLKKYKYCRMAQINHDRVLLLSFYQIASNQFL